ncbi:MAG: tetratricopeptide repeat protein [Candidatus Amulumruptor caecigallinarius]|nr:tetratricopeptide repeat protein [Candidatus Amulumruptor caecigallinarius]MCM1397242.1 tetratricopeptide repeat protein [Candidatus Amulumruptor caecigallinarius]MCM1453084.1 tetratricopeptide repeat protein [bacterium]
MKLRTLMAGGILMLGAAIDTPTAGAQAMTRSAREMLKATMGTYDKILAENPNDYQTLYRRANGYYRQDSYGQALGDVNKAIEKAPKSETGFLFDAYSLRAGIYERLAKYDLASADYKRALEIAPKDYNARYQLANIQFESGNYAAAKESYQALKRLNPRSQEALFGLARVAVKEGKDDEAKSLLKQAVDLNPTAAVTYMRLANVQRLMGNNVDAVDNYTVALSLDRNMMTPALREMAQVAATDYPAVMDGLQKAIDKNPRSGTYYFIRGVIAKTHFHYLPALKDFNVIVERNLLNLPSVYTEMAECYYALGDYATALEKADYAIGSSADNRDAYVMKSRIKAAQGAWAAAIENADKAIEKNADYAPAYVAKALAQEGYKLYPEANVTFSKALELDNRRPAYYFDRAYLLKHGLGLPAQAPSFYQDAAKLPFKDDQVISLKGFALLELGDTVAADAWMDNITTNVKDSDGEIAYYAACYWAMRGDTDKALKYVEDALKAGYANYRNWTEAVNGGVNVGTLRDNQTFKELLARHSDLFK